MDAARLGYNTTAMISAFRAIDLEGSLATQMSTIHAADVVLVE
jgi:hypothetical protein